MNIIIYEGIPSNCIHNPNSLTQLASVSGSNFTRTGDYINGATCQITLAGHNGTVEIGRIIHPDNTNKYYDIVDIKWDTTGNTVVIGVLNYLVTFYSKIHTQTVYLTGSTNPQARNENIIPPGFISGNRAVRERLNDVIDTDSGFTDVGAPVSFHRVSGPWAYITVSMSALTLDELTDNGETSADNAFCTYVFDVTSSEFKLAMAEINSNLQNLLSSGVVINVTYGVSIYAISHTSHKYTFRMGNIDIINTTSAYIVSSRISRAVDKFTIDLTGHTTPNYGACQRSIRFPDGFVLTLPKSMNNKKLHLGYSIDTFKQSVTWLLHDEHGSVNAGEPGTYLFKHTINYSAPIPYKQSDDNNTIAKTAIAATSTIGSVVATPVAGAMISAVGSSMASALTSGDSGLGNNTYQSGEGVENFFGDMTFEWFTALEDTVPSRWINVLFSVYDEYCPTYQTTPITYGTTESTAMYNCTDGLYIGKIFGGLESPIMNIVNGVLQNGFYVVN